MEWEGVKEHCSTEARLPCGTDHQHSERKPGSSREGVFPSMGFSQGWKKIGKRAKRMGWSVLEHRAALAADKEEDMTSTPEVS